MRDRVNAPLRAAWRLGSTTAVAAALVALCAGALRGFAELAGRSPSLRECAVAALLVGLHVAACGGFTAVLLEIRAKVRARHAAARARDGRPLH